MKYYLTTICIIHLLNSLSLLSAQDCATRDTIYFEKKFATADTKYYSSEIKTPIEVKEYSFLKGIPNNNEKFKIFEIPIDEHLDTIDLANQLENINKIYTYVGLDTIKKIKTIIVDVNCNLDFADDKQYIFSLDDYTVSYNTTEHHKLCPIIEISCPDKSKNEYDSFCLKVDPFSSDKAKESYPTLEDYYLEFLFYTCNYLKGNISIAGKEYIVHAQPNYTYNLNKWDLGKRPTFFIFQPTDTIFPHPYKGGDTLILENKSLILKDIQPTNLIVELQDYEENDLMSKIFVKDLQHEKITLSQIIKDKYVFIDFWGSWCKPCIESIPKLLELYKKIENRKDVIILGIALEKDEDKSVDDLKTRIAENNIQWNNYWVSFSDLKSTASPQNRLKVEAYPTYLIIDNKGEIVYEISSSENTQNAIDFFQKLIDKK